MTLRVVWTPEASADLDEAMLWQESPRGSRQSLSRRVDATVSAIADNPLQFALRHREIRRARVHGFPYGVFFLVEATRVVIACFHARRNPRGWQSRQEP